MAGLVHGAIEALVNAVSAIIASFSGLYGSIISYATGGGVSVAQAWSNSTVSIGVSLASMFLTMELFSKMAEFRVERIEDAIRIGMKLVVGKIIIENSTGICAGVYALLSKVGNLNMGAVLHTLDANWTATWDYAGDKTGFETAFKDGFGIPSILVFIFFLVASALMIMVLINIAFTLVGVIVEYAIHAAVAPIALSTLCNDIARSTGISFIKSVAAVALTYLGMQIGIEMYSSINAVAIQGHLPTPAGADVFMKVILNGVTTIFPLALLSAMIKKAPGAIRQALGSI